jgi:hypothetical protein
MDPQAIVRILIPLDRSKDEEQNEEKKEEEKKEDNKEVEKKEEGEVVIGEKEQQPQEVVYPEIEYEDKVLMVKPISDNLYVLVLHQAAARELRKSMCEYIKAHFDKDFETTELEPMQKKAEEIGVAMEKKFLAHFPGVPIFCFEKN